MMLLYCQFSFTPFIKQSLYIRYPKIEKKPTHRGFHFGNDYIFQGNIKVKYMTNQIPKCGSLCKEKQ